MKNQKKLEVSVGRVDECIGALLQSAGSVGRRALAYVERGEATLAGGLAHFAASDAALALALLGADDR